MLHPFNPSILVNEAPNGAHDVARFAWPGGYPVFYITSDGAALCPSCVSEEIDQCCDPESGGRHVVGHAANWEDAHLHCDHCGERIESAYAEDETA